MHALVIVARFHVVVVVVVVMTFCHWVGYMASAFCSVLRIAVVFRKNMRSLYSRGGLKCNLTHERLAKKLRHFTNNKRKN